MNQPTQNIAANIGSVDSTVYQHNGTDRLKGSYPFLIQKVDSIFENIINIINNKSKYNHGRFSRISIRYFVEDSLLNTLKKNIDNKKIGDFFFKIEAVVPLKKELFRKRVSWVWLGGNISTRLTGKTVKTILLDTITSAEKISHTYTSQYDPLYQYYILGTKERIQNTQYFTQQIPVREITQYHAEMIAQLYKTRIPVYVADNSDPHYVRTVIAQSPDTELFVAINTVTHEISAVIANEFTRYPISTYKETDSVLVCESNDWVKTKNMPSAAFLDFLKTTCNAAYSAKPDIIETECVPEAVRAALAAGFTYAGLLERTSYIQTDGKNSELFDEETEAAFRKFNSLALFYKSL